MDFAGVFQRRVGYFYTQDLQVDCWTAMQLTAVQGCAERWTVYFFLLLLV